MNDEPEQGDAASADAALRQLRRRYDDLRTDYESLLERLTELEERADATADSAMPASPPGFGIVDQLLGPLAALRDEYLEALSSLERVVGGLEDLLPRGMKAQRGGGPRADLPGGRRIQLDVRGQGPRDLLEFRERIAAMEGVLAVSIHAIDAERAVLVVELA